MEVVLSSVHSARCRIERERVRRERESEKKKKWGARGKHRRTFLSLENSSHKLKKKEKSFWFLIPRGALVLFILQNFIRAYHDRE